MQAIHEDTMAPSSGGVNMPIAAYDRIHEASIAPMTPSIAP
jgi:hypothetical protein